MASLAQAPPPKSLSHSEFRRHSSAGPADDSESSSRNGSTSSTKSQPAWMGSIQERDRQKSSSSSSSHGLKGLFGKKKTEKTQEKAVITSKHTASLGNTLKADPRGARKHPSVPTKTAGVQGTQKSAHITAEQQEMRYPHSGPPTLRGTAHLPVLTRIVSDDEEDEWDREKAHAERATQKVPEMEKVFEADGEEEKAADIETGGVELLQPRRKSLLDVEIKGAEGVKPVRRRTVFGGWVRDEQGVWHRG